MLVQYMLMHQDCIAFSCVDGALSRNFNVSRSAVSQYVIVINNWQTDRAASLQCRRLEYDSSKANCAF